VRSTAKPLTRKGNPSCSVEVAASKKGATQLLVSRRDSNPRGFGGEVPQAVGVIRRRRTKGKSKKAKRKRGGKKIKKVGK